MKTFKDFIEEAKAPKPDALKTISKNWQRKPGHKGLNLYTSQSDLHGKPHIKVHDVWVPKHLRKHGIGGRIMKGLTKYADKNNASMSLTQQAEPGYKEKLNKFYSKHGFKPNKGRNKDYAVSDSHIRPAKT